MCAHACVCARLSVYLSVCVCRGMLPKNFKRIVLTLRDREAGKEICGSHSVSANPILFRWQVILPLLW